MGQRIKHRRDTAAAWTAANPILTAGEFGCESVTNKIKIGDGVTAWNSLAYFGGGALVEGTNNVKAINATAAQTVAHALGGLPKFCELVLLCNVASNGYAVGEYVRSVSSNFSYSYDATSTTISHTATAPSIAIFPKTGGAALNITAANWSIVVRPYK